MKVRLKELMQAKGITGRQLAAMMGTTPQYISNLVNERQSLSLNTIEEISRHLQTEPWELFASREEILGEKNNEVVEKCPHCGKPITIRTSLG